MEALSTKQKKQDVKQVVIAICLEMYRQITKMHKQIQENLLEKQIVPPLKVHLPLNLDLLSFDELHLLQINLLQEQNQLLQKYESMFLDYRIISKYLQFDKEALERENQELRDLLGGFNN